MADENETVEQSSWDKVAKQAEALYPEIFIGKDTIELTSLIEQVRQITHSPIIVDTVKIFLCAVTAFQLRQYIKKVEDRDALIKELADGLENDFLCDMACDVHGECLAGDDMAECRSVKYRALVAKAREVVK